MKPRLLDLFAGAGGCSVGYARAGFDVYGVDIAPQPRYPFRFFQADAIEFAENNWQAYDAIAASPPCQAYTDLQKQNGRQYPKLIEPVRELLRWTGLPYVIENVDTAPLEDPIMLCGTMFPRLRVLRHRLFESNFHIDQPEHPPHPLVFTHDKRKRHYGRLDQDVSFVQVTGGGNCTVANARDAMGVDWEMTKDELNEAIPPAYASHVGSYLLAHLDAERKAAA